MLTMSNELGSPRENGFGFKAQGNCIMRTCTWDEGAAFGEWCSMSEMETENFLLAEVPS